MSSCCRLLIVAGTIALVAIGMSWTRPSPESHAQNPIASGFMRDLEYPQSDPGDGANVLVVQGMSFGLNNHACDSHEANLVALITISAINAGMKTVTEISPQDYCDSNLQDWKDVLSNLVTNVENSAPNAATLWGGIMLDEEDDFWGGGGVYAFVDLNNYVESLMLGTPGLPRYYTENYSVDLGLHEFAWTQDAFDVISGESIPAPQIANARMANLVNYWHDRGARNTLVTWSLGYPAPFNTFYYSQYFVNGPSANEWGVNISNCFTNGVLRCDDWDGDGVTNSADNCISVANSNQTNTDGDNAALNLPGGDPLGDACDPDADGDGYSDSAETAIGENPLSYCRIMRADIDGDHTVSILDISSVAHWFGSSIPPAPERDNQDAGAQITLLDLSRMTRWYTINVSACP